MRGSTCTSRNATALAFEFLTLTATRSGEVRGARWSEVDRAAQMWVVTSDRVKSGREHRVPLSGQAMAILEAAKALSDGDPDSLIFASTTGRMLSDSTLSKLVRELGIGCVPHGMRSSFREWAAERTDIPREVAEEALAHVNPNKVESAYQRSDLFDRRCELMNSWTAYLVAEFAAVVPTRGAGRMRRDQHEHWPRTLRYLSGARSGREAALCGSHVSAALRFDDENTSDFPQLFS